MHSERGKLLFRVAADRRSERNIWTVVAVGYAVICAFDIYRRHWTNLGMYIFFAGYGLSFFFFRKVAFYENGVHFPRDPSGARERFIAWPQVERFHWDDDVLTIVPSTSLLTGSGGSAVGGTVRIPGDKRVTVENLLSRVTAYSRDAGA